MTLKTANVGGIDRIYHKVNVEFDCYTNPIEGMSNRKASKWYKTHHDSDVIWIDGSVSIIKDGFVDFVQRRLGDCDFMVAEHPSRNTLREEYDYLIRCTHLENYLKVRYADEDWEAEREALKDGLDAKLINPRFFAYRESAKPLMDEWWDLIDKYTVFDQSQLSYLLHVKDYDHKTISWNELGEYCFIHAHSKLM